MDDSPSPTPFHPSVVVAMDKFKGSATAEQACAQVSAGIHDEQPGWSCLPVPMADGGDGTVAALVRAGWDEVMVPTIDAQGEAVTASVARRGDTAVIELANICGLARWRGDLQPWHAHTIGVGMVMRRMVDDGVARIVVGLGGSASTDGGAGALTGLGFGLLDANGEPVDAGLVGLRSVDRIEPPTDVARLAAVEWTVLVDVDSPLCGPRGAAARFGPQKGLTGADVDAADRLLRRWDDVLRDLAGRHVGSTPGTGAAGGVAAALVAVLGARIVPGFDFVAEQVGLRAALGTADAVVTGEGRLDASSLSGKVPGAVMGWAGEVGIPVFVIAGDVVAGWDDELAEDRIPAREHVVSLVDVAGDLLSAMGDPDPHLREAGRRVGRLLRD